MDPIAFFTLIALGAAIGCVLGYFVTGDGYGWAFNGVAGMVGALGGTQIMGNTSLDLGLIVNAILAASAASLVSSMVLRT